MHPHMYRTLLGSCLIGLATLSPLSHATEATVVVEQVNIDYRPITALKRMGAALRELKAFEITTQATHEKVLTNGQKIQIGGSTLIEYVAPNQFNASVETANKAVDFYFDGKQATLYSPKKGYYSTVDYTGSVREMLDTVESKYGLAVPLKDLFIWGTPEADNVQFDSAIYVGRDFVGEVLCDHYAFRQGSVDWQIWIESTERLLPRKVAITNTADAAMPQHVEILDWNTAPKFAATHFTFKAPANATAIKFSERAAQ
ncbi:DUF2092 domain-containing protein [Chitinibacter sp. SCUT-21]|uniref:DUF2092 domain-containing protein n=1 Tax=Chitinibacter sp. SCUT-21 TaxID=2970891 RepID=UPI0035A58B17